MQNSKEKTLSQRIAERIIKYILEENLQPGDKLPNETVMCGTAECWKKLSA